MNEYFVVFITASSADEAASIARVLVEERLAACVNVIPSIRSFYWWEGKVCEEGEVMMIAKTRRALFEGLKERVFALHSYDVPEVIGFGIQAGSESYLSWIDEVLSTDGGGG